jgi:glycosyltransferase involved in cell wall biosynthesis
MKKVIILSYFFPPCQLTASQRSFGWAKCLKNEGWDPIVITRNWEHHIGGPDDMHHDSGTEIIINKSDNFEAHYLPFKGNMRDRLYAKHGKSKYTLIRKALSLSELFLHHYSNKVIAFSNLYDYALAYCKAHKDVEMIVVTGNPFELFRFGWLLQKNTGIPWIADYRDDWTTSEVNHSRGIADGILRSLERRSEKKWVGSSAAITSISPYYVKKISEFTERPGQVILNGFFEQDFAEFQNQELEESFTVVYNGMLYPSQQIEVFLDAFKRLADAHPAKRNRIKLRFPGILFLKHVAERVSNYMKGYEDLVEMTERISRQEVLLIQAKAHLLLMVSHKDAIGIPSSKIYEYLGLGKTVMVCPGDRDILDETFQGYNLGYIAYTADEAFVQLEELFANYLNGNFNEIKPDRKYISTFNRNEQAAVLARFMDQLLEHPGK